MYMLSPGIDIYIVYQRETISPAKASQGKEERTGQTSAIDILPCLRKSPESENLSKAAHWFLEVKIIVGNMIMDQKPERYITDKLQCRRLLANATACCGDSRPRMYWVDFEIAPYENETLSKEPHRNELEMVDIINKLDFWDPHMGPTQRLQRSFPMHCWLGKEGTAPRGPQRPP